MRKASGQVHDSKRGRGRPTFGDHPRQLIALRLDPALITRLREMAAERGIGYQTLIHQLLTQAAAEYP